MAEAFGGGKKRVIWKDGTPEHKIERKEGRVEIQMKERNNTVKRCSEEGGSKDAGKTMTVPDHVIFHFPTDLIQTVQC